MRSWWWLRPTSSVLALLVVGCGAHVLPAIHSDAERLRIGRDLYEHRDYPDAIELLKTYITNASGTAQVDEAIYLLGACYLKTKDWALASGEFERLLRDYPESDSAGAASFRLGEALFGQTRPADFDQEYTVKALEQWQNYLRSYPGHWLNPEAERRVSMCRDRLAAKLVSTGELYLKLKQVRPARTYFRRALVEYPDRAATPDAELGLALCEARLSGPDAAITQLRELESRYAGQPVAQRAAAERKRLERQQR